MTANNGRIRVYKAGIRRFPKRKFERRLGRSLVELRNWISFYRYEIAEVAETPAQQLWIHARIDNLDKLWHLIQEAHSYAVERW